MSNENLFDHNNLLFLKFIASLPHNYSLIYNMITLYKEKLSQLPDSLTLTQCNDYIQTTSHLYETNIKELIHFFESSQKQSNNNISIKKDIVNFSSGPSDTPKKDSKLDIIDAMFDEKLGKWCSSQSSASDDDYYKV